MVRRSLRQATEQICTLDDPQSGKAGWPSAARADDGGYRVDGAQLLRMYPEPKCKSSGQKKSDLCKGYCLVISPRNSLLFRVCKC